MGHDAKPTTCFGKFYKASAFGGESLGHNKKRI